MKLEYNPRNILRVVPAQLLQEYFDQRQLLTDYDWDSFSVDSLYAAWAWGGSGIPGPSEYIDLIRRRTDQVVEPRSGPAVLIDPRRDDPLQYLSLDLIDTFWFVPRHAEGTREHARAEYTIKCLKLNERDYLPRARQEAYAGYRARLVEYVEARDTGRAEHLAKAISRCGHRAVWAEMKAQSFLLPDLAELFAAAPEASAW